MLSNFLSKNYRYQKTLKENCQGGFIYFGLNSLAQLHRITLNGKWNFYFHRFFTEFLNMPYISHPWHRYHQKADIRPLYYVQPLIFQHWKIHVRIASRFI